MLKKIQKSELRLGMYIHDLECPWIHHSFIRKSFMLRKEADLARILEEKLTEVWIDTLKGLDLAGPEAPPADPGRSPEAGRDPAAADPSASAAPRVSHLEELPIALQIRNEASEVIHSLLMDVRMGRQIQVERLHPMVARITESILRNPGTLVSLCRIREADSFTFRHSLSSCALMIMFGHHLRLDPAVLHEAGVGGMLHDIGKMQVPDHILNKPGRLTDAEFAIMQDHVRLGLETLRQTPGVSPSVMQVAAEHHERCDGSGYPGRLKASELSLLGRMAAIVDVYDAITSIRIYHSGIEPASALQHLYEWSAGEFDQELVQRFIQAIGIYPVGSLVRLESNRLAVVMEQSQDGLLHPKVRVVYDIGQCRPLAPFDLDLTPADGGDAILGHEEPRAWNLDPAPFLALELPD
jgi:putative nucleotidyltransferase with HDIG domain